MLNITSNFDDNSTAFRTNKIHLLIMYSSWQNGDQQGLWP